MNRLRIEGKKGKERCFVNGMEVSESVYVEAVMQNRRIMERRYVRVETIERMRHGRGGPVTETTRVTLIPRREHARMTEQQLRARVKANGHLMGALPQ